MQCPLLEGFFFFMGRGKGGWFLFTIYVLLCDRIREGKVRERCLAFVVEGGEFGHGP